MNALKRIVPTFLLLCLVIESFAQKANDKPLKETKAASQNNDSDPDKGNGGSEKQPDASKQDPSKAIWNNITFLNAANFDFSDNISGSYLGKLNIFAPDIRSSLFGFNAGIMRTKYNYKDSSNSTYTIENRLIHPLDSIKQGTKYLRQFNRYTSTLSNTVWSFYIQPTFRIVSWPWKKGKYQVNGVLPNGIYLHLHGELLVNKANITTSITAIQQDTALIDTSKRLSYIGYLPNPLIYDHTFLNGYFGAGITINVDPFGNGNSRFFCQITAGTTTDYPNWVNQDISTTTVRVVPTRGGTTIQYAPRTAETKTFFLVRSEFQQQLSSNSQLIIGTDIRGLGKYNPMYAAYIGLNINLDALAKIVSDKKEEKPAANGTAAKTKED